MASQVTEGGVALLLQNPSPDSATPSNVVLQVLELKPVGSTRYTFLVNDGKLKMKAMLPSTMSAFVVSGKLQNMGLIRINDYTCNVVPNQPQKVLIITDCEVVSPALDHEIGAQDVKDNKFNLEVIAKVKLEGSAKASGAVQHKSAAQIIEEQHGKAAPAARMGISRRVSPLVSLNPYQGNWTIKVRVTSKGPLRTYRNARGEGNVFNVELTDEDGTQIQATMFKEAADKFFSKFELGKVYYISKGVLRVANKQYSTLNNNYEMTLNVSAEVEEVADALSSQIPTAKYNFVKLDGLGPFINGKELVDIVGVVQNVSPTISVRRKSDNEEIPKRDITVADQSQKTVSVSLWNDLAVKDGEKLLEMLHHAPTVLIKGLRVSDFQGVSLSTTHNSMVIINPDIPDAQAIRSWYDRDGKEATMTSAGASLPSGTSRGSWSVFADRAFICDITVPEVGEGKPAFFNVRACISFVKPEQPMWYLACGTCNRKVTEEGHSSFWCEGCQKRYETCNRRYIMSAKMTDSTGETWISAFNEQAEQLLGHSAEELAKIRSQDDNGKSYLAELTKVSWHPRIFRLSVAQTEYMNEKRQRITIRSVHNVDWAAESNYLLEQIALLKSKLAL
ncbi:hypothetical protein O6H91_02G027800 [Diphasiastrum complanatum]|uniref:Uncharacterized protein n=2 Tax=Diphasiastrum complanatum TaxID=34168 RepID=A0ACC2EE17_DIPCM|nr:hypothetical protein O6H91_Y391100 [Diphasiastrum complanatum]KAJ7277072.1 hypothetical protein O6H91_Y391100 [Diphasiastrum complanatum]KAJ7564652.1 hypothetical protein O6H91_02G027800 [Diphasiastrum complanatum]KAJ7564653.1 hypothetical protein O6H91_02G027800 [Diphasiastrum complanatum]